MEFSNIFAEESYGKQEKELDHLEIITAMDWELEVEAADLWRRFFLLCSS